MFKLYHGTTLDGAISIPHEGYKGKFGNAWTCSDSRKVYFYSPSRFMEYEGYDDINFASEEAMRRANENAQIQNAILKFPYPYTAVLECMFLGEEKYKVLDDFSCQGMDLAVVIDSKNFNKMVREKRCEIILHFFPFSVKSSLLYLAGINSEYFKKGESLLPNFELSILEFLKKEDMFCEDLLDFSSIETDISCEDIYKLVNNNKEFLR